MLKQIKKIYLNLVLLIFLLSIFLVAILNPAFKKMKVAKASADISAEPLLQKVNLQYMGAFRVPTGISGYAYSQGTIAYNKDNNSLFIVGSMNYPSSTDNNHVSEIGIPAILGNSSNVLSLPVATLLQSSTDITEGNKFQIGTGGSTVGTTNGVNIGGLLVNNLNGTNKLIGSVYSYYDASQTAILSHFISGTNLNQTNDFQGMFKVGSSSQVLQAGFIAGYMADIPSSWQALLGGKILSGKAGIPIVSRTSYGPSAFAIDPADLGNGTMGSEANPLSATPLVYYDQAHRTLGAWAVTPGIPANEYVSLGDNINGIVFPEETKSILFFGRHGSENCYGPGTTILAQKWNGPGTLAGTGADQCEGGDVANGNYCCFDIRSNIYNKGTHSYPFKAYIWAYNADDFAAVKAGQKNPWDLIPYAVWDFSLPTTSYNGQEKEIFIGGAAYDSVNQRIFVTQNQIDGNDPKPIIHVYKININSNSNYSIPNFISLLSEWLHINLGNFFDLNFDNNINTRDLGIMMSKWN